MTLQTRAAENFRLCRWGDERTVKCDGERGLGEGGYLLLLVSTGVASWTLVRLGEVY